MRTRAGRKAIVIGGSMGGLFTALLLRRDGWDVDVYERIGVELGGRGAGIVTHDALYQVLRRAGIDVAPRDLGVSVPGRRVLAKDGSVYSEVRLAQVLTSWGRLFALLRAELPARHYHQGKDFSHAVETDHGVVAHFTDGSRTEEADLLVGADGLFSAARRQFLPEVKPLYAGYIAWRGLVDEKSLSGKTRQSLCDWFAFGLPEGEQILGYPVAGADEAVTKGDRRFNFVWYRPAAGGGELTELLTDTEGVRHELSIPPNRIRPAVIERLRADASRLLPPQFAEVVQSTAQPFIQAILDLETPHMALGGRRRVAILGDAAFVARPHVGMGVTKAACDAAALARALARSDDVASALAGFEQERLPSGTAVIQRARHLGAYMQAQLRTDEERAMAERHRSPEAVIVETAAPAGLAA
jgi:2-polyprenyl-6-methoxyphenol hydroxylase-like FAD-dependent oxidoreductase